MNKPTIKLTLAERFVQMALKKRLIILTIITVCLVIVGGTAVWFIEKEQLWREQVHFLETELAHKIKQAQEQVLSNAVALSSDPRIVKVLKSGVHADAYAILRGSYRSFSNNLEIQGMQFKIHRPKRDGKFFRPWQMDAKTFALSAKPKDLYADSKYIKSISVSGVMEDLKPRIAVELDQLGIALRGLVPVLDTKQKLRGVYEFSQPLHTFLSFGSFSASETWLMHNKHASNISYDSESVANWGENYLLRVSDANVALIGLADQIDWDELQDKGWFDVAGYLIVKVAIKDWLGNEVGKLVSWQSKEKLYPLLWQKVYIYLAIMLVSLVLLSLMIWFVLSFQKKQIVTKLNSWTKVLKKVNQEGQLNSRIKVDKSALSPLGNQINSFLERTQSLVQKTDTAVLNIANGKRPESFSKGLAGDFEQMALAVDFATEKLVGGRAHLHFSPADGFIAEPITNKPVPVSGNVEIEDADAGAGTESESESVTYAYRETDDETTEVDTGASMDSDSDELDDPHTLVNYAAMSLDDDMNSSPYIGPVEIEATAEEQFNPGESEPSGDDVAPEPHADNFVDTSVQNPFEGGVSSHAPVHQVTEPDDDNVDEVMKFEDPFVGQDKSFVTSSIPHVAEDLDDALRDESVDAVQDVNPLTESNENRVDDHGKIEENPYGTVEPDGLPVSTSEQVLQPTADGEDAELNNSDDMDAYGKELNTRISEIDAQIGVIESSKKRLEAWEQENDDSGLTGDLGISDDIEDGHQVEEQLEEDPAVALMESPYPQASISQQTPKHTPRIFGTIAKPEQYEPSAHQPTDKAWHTTQETTRDATPTNERNDTVASTIDVKNKKTNWVPSWMRQKFVETTEEKSDPPEVQMAPSPEEIAEVSLSTVHSHDDINAVADEPDESQEERPASHEKAVASDDDFFSNRDGLDFDSRVSNLDLEADELDDDFPEKSIGSLPDEEDIEHDDLSSIAAPLDSEPHEVFGAREHNKQILSIEEMDLEDEPDANLDLNQFSEEGDVLDRKSTQDEQSDSKESDTNVNNHSGSGQRDLFS